MAATSRKWILVTLAINIVIAVLYGGGFLSDGVTSGTTPTWGSDGAHTANITAEYAKQDGRVATDTSSPITYMATGENVIWYVGKIIGLLLLGVPIAAVTFVTYTASYGLGTFIGLASAILSLVFGILTVYFAMAVYFLLFKPKSD